MEQLFELLNPILVGLIIAGTEGLKRLIPSLNSRITTIAVSIVFALIFYLVDNPVNIIEGIIAFMGAVVGYDFILEPIKNLFKGSENSNSPPIANN